MRIQPRESFSTIDRHFEESLAIGSIYLLIAGPVTIIFFHLVGQKDSRQLIVSSKVSLKKSD